MSDWLKALAPTLGTAIGGPLAGAAASFIASKLGMSDSSIESVAEVLSSNKLTPEQLGSIKLAEIDFKKFLEANKIDLERIALANTQGARDMRIATKSVTADVLAVVVVAGFFAILVLMMTGSLTVSDQQALLILLGSLSAGFGAVLNFFFGSSKGSQNKDVLLASSTLK